MPKSTHDQPQQIVHLGIMLDHVVPEVSRIAPVPLGIHLDMLHLVLQAAMGWSNTHLWLIEAGDSTWGVPDPDFGDDTLPANGTTLIDMVADTGVRRFCYLYDFGDQWQHTIKIVKPMPAVPGVAYPLLIDAAGRCPLEDSGGPSGYADLLGALHDALTRAAPRLPNGPDSNSTPPRSIAPASNGPVGNLAKLMTPRSGRRATPRSRTKRGKSKGDEWF